MNPVATVNFKHNGDGKGYLSTQVQFPIKGVSELTTESIKKYVIGFLALNNYRNLKDVVIDVEEFV